MSPGVPLALVRRGQQEDYEEDDDAIAHGIGRVQLTWDDMDDDNLQGPQLVPKPKNAHPVNENSV